MAQLLVKVQNPTTRELYARQLAGGPGSDQPAGGAGVARSAGAGTARGPGAERRRELTGPARSGAGGGTSRRCGHRAARRPAVRPRRPPSGASAPCRATSWSCWRLLATYPDAGGSPEAARAGDLLVDPAARQLFRTARGDAAAGRLDVPAWLEAGPPDVRRSLTAALMDAGLSGADNPAVKLRALACPPGVATCGSRNLHDGAIAGPGPEPR